MEKKINLINFKKNINKINLLKHKQLSVSISDNTHVFEKIYNPKINKDIVFRKFNLLFNKKTYNCAIIFIDGLCDTNSINNSILKSLMLESKSLKHDLNNSLTNFIKETILLQYGYTTETKIDNIISAINLGSCALLIDSLDFAYICDTKKNEHRQISKPINEISIKGSSSAFVESLKSNTSLIRKIVNDENLILEQIPVGKRSNTICAMGYISNLANPNLVDNVRNRLKNISIDYLIDSGQLEQLIDDHPLLLAPQIISTERPDKIASHLSEGRICIIVDNSPQVLVVPCVFWDLFHSAEDYCIRFQFANFLRLIRLLAYFLSLFLPGIYIALTGFHTELLPTDLLFSIAAIKESIPFPLVVEILIMEVSLELIREAGARMPGSIGSSLGIVGAVLLGQASVEANLVSPLLILVVAITAICSFATPNYSLALSFRILRFGYIILANFLGLFGIFFGAIIHLTFLCSIYTFGIPYFTSLAKYSKKPFRDGLFISPIWINDFRPPFLNPLDIRKAPKISRKWDKKGQGNNV